MRTYRLICLLALSCTLSLCALYAQHPRGAQARQQQEQLREAYAPLLDYIAQHYASPLANEVLPGRKKLELTADPLVYEGITEVESEGMIICKMRLSWIDKAKNVECVVDGRVYIYAPHTPSNGTSVCQFRYYYDTANEAVWDLGMKGRLRRLTESKLYRLDYEDEE